MVKTPAISEYQVRQTERGVDLSVVADAPIDEEALQAALVASLRRAGLDPPEATVRRVAAIARDAQTGKARHSCLLRRG